MVSSYLDSGRNSPKYFVLLILTDGEASGMSSSRSSLILWLTAMQKDLDETKRAIIAAAELPISIIIIGIGEDDFARMHESFDVLAPPVQVDGKVAPRDIVQVWTIVAPLFRAAYICLVLTVEVLL